MLRHLGHFYLRISYSTPLTQSLPIDQMRIRDDPSFEDAFELPMSRGRGEQSAVLMASRDVHFDLTVGRSPSVLVDLLVPPSDVPLDVEQRRPNLAPIQRSHIGFHFLPNLRPGVRMSQEKTAKKDEAMQLIDDVSFANNQRKTYLSTKE